jgi:cytochrome b6
MVGEFALRLLRGGDQVTGGTLTRFYGIHVAILPALTTVILGAHLMLVQKHGMSVPPKIEAESERTGEPLRSHAFLPNFLIRDAIGWCAALGVLAGLAAVFPWELGVKADPFASAPAGIRPEWYFGWMFQSLKMLPPHILGFEGEVLGILAISAAALVWLVVPFLDRTPRPGNRVSLAFIVAGWLALVYMAVTTAMVYWPAKG